MTEAAAGRVVLDARGVAKRFGAVAALKDASLTVKAGEIVALMGANGAGKSTFVKILTGALRPDSGHIHIDGQESRFTSPAQARRAGIMPVYQEPSLIPDLDVGDNLRLVDAPIEPFRHWVDALGITNLRLDDTISQLPLATLRILDLALTLAKEPKVLMLDEMTAALPTDLVERVLTVIRGQADAGRTVIYISHRFAEIARVCDRASVLRDGVTVGDFVIEPGIEEKIVELMLGGVPTRAEVTGAHIRAVSSAETPRLRVSQLAAGSRLADVSFELRKGEVLGVVALEGQGQDELFDVLAGFRRAQGGTIEVDGKAASFGHPADAIAKGLTLVPGDRKDALLMLRSVRENIALPLLARPSKWGAIPMREEAARVTGAVERLQIDMRAQAEVRRLSGGNQQKVTIGRWVAAGVETLLLFDPTRGIDVRTKHQIYPLLRELAAQGASILFYTSELGEIPLACDRAIVIFGGRIVDVIDAEAATEQNLMRAAYGLTEKERAASSSAEARP
ncbi:sugar ABC transporter ATP-binding protein [Devosia psychrophila]|uniref:Monosaccharide ABC transporter ATP-binding protein, CUT2 family n=1 Tax=Devosia psychrophila TaxID=728005 RepID=A0A0F5PVT3_9HYPH|nr:sugar ABC transporter ATP-binding protein [Devosia psychrophila]KKC32797.1 sugar ABC transporter [Devosia psychrophila]SFD21126.1 monosaccharide ABC transporter ATP-binding protein, CUT2 family [Devosia psychrophila]